MATTATNEDLRELEAIDAKLFGICDRLRSEDKHRLSQRVEKARQLIALAVFRETRGG